MLFYKNMKAMPVFITLAIISNTLLFCTKSHSVSRVVVQRYNQQDILDVAYGNDDVKQKYDIYLPLRRSDQITPVVFFIHGGGWTAGDKSDLSSVIPILRQGLPKYAFVVANYRLYEQTSDSYKFPAQEKDIKDCIEKVFNDSAVYHISTKFMLWGQSAGAQLATLYAYKYGAVSFRPVGVVDQSGPTDMLALYKASSIYLKILINQLAGNPDSHDTIIYNSSSPIRYLNAGCSPTLILQGKADDVVPYQQAELLNAGLQQLNVPHIYKLYPGEGHLLLGVSTEVNQEIIAFMHQYLD
jgi:acetyl esterase/lipase